jgi:L-2-hydroxyglutarate oxidase LhgO
VQDQTWDIAIIGGGIIGLASALELLTRQPSIRLIVLEKEQQIAQHQSGHNSGVIHSGMYYNPGSLKARACVTGKSRLIRFCDEHAIPYELCGKVIVATDAEELPRLENLYQRGIANEVPGLELIGPERLHGIEPHCVGVKALWAPTTGIVDFARVAAKYAELVVARGGVIRCNHRVEAIERRNGYQRLGTSSGTIEARYIISCAGLHSDRVAQLTGASEHPRIVPFRGDYYVLRPERRDLVKGLIYPVPDPRFPFLGVHFTRRIDGDVWLGPNAVLAFAREGYRRLDFNLRDLIESLRYRGFQRLAAKFWRTGLDEMYRDFSKSAFLKALQRYMPTLTAADLLPGPSGVRAQALAPDGSLVEDFTVDHQNDTIHVRNAPSPAATSSLAIAEMIADTAHKAFNLNESLASM